MLLERSGRLADHPRPPRGSGRAEVCPRPHAYRHSVRCDYTPEGQHDAESETDTAESP